MGGVDLIALVVGLFAISEVFLGLEESRVAIATKIRNVFPRWADLRQAWPAIMRGTGIGFLLGLLPGCSPGVTVFLAYDVEKKLARHPERFGKGAIEGVASPESANNATSSAGFIRCALCIRLRAAGLMLGGLMVSAAAGRCSSRESESSGTVIASLYVGNVICSSQPAARGNVGALNRSLRNPRPGILLMSFVGAYSVRNECSTCGELVFRNRRLLLRKFSGRSRRCCWLHNGPLLGTNLLESRCHECGSVLLFQRWPSLALIVAATSCS